MRADWTAEQRAALTAEGHRLLVANAGTGKTTTVIGKIMWLLGEDVGVPKCANPCRLDEIAAITFTEKAAYDLKRKLREEIAKSPRADELKWEIETAALGTIHSFCGQLLRENALRMGIDPGFNVLDERDAKVQQDLIIRDIVLERLAAGDMEAADLVRTYRLQGFTYTNGAVDLVRIAFRDLRWHGERYRAWTQDEDEDEGGNAGELDLARLRRLFTSSSYSSSSLDDVVLSRCAGLYRMARLACERWAEHERVENVRDFDSLILSARALLSGPDGAAALAGIRRRYRILIIDEFQDTDGAQRDIAYAIARHVDRPQLFLVGDPKQSIYRFRGADISVWNQVAQDIGSENDVLPLSENFRSVEPIIKFVNVVAEGAVNETAHALRDKCGEEGVRYTRLTAARQNEPGEVEWIVPRGDREDERRDSEADHVAARIEELVQSGTASYRDIALLYRTRTGLNAYKEAMRARGIPLFDSSPAGLAERQEVQDLVNLLRVLANPADDLRMFALLRSPFIGLRDEVLVRMRVDAPFSSYFRQAVSYAERNDWFVAPEHPDLTSVERDALAVGLSAFKRARLLADRIPVDELLQFVLDETGYRQHLLLMEGSREALASIDGFLHLAEQYRQLTIGRFLELWDDRDDDDPGLPQGQLYSSRDDVVTFSTIHGAKGLEWPVVFMVDTSAAFKSHRWGEYWRDPQLGPILCPAAKDRGDRAQLIADRDLAQLQAEQARLLYVATTRARDRLIVLGETESKNSQAKWLERGFALTTVQDGETPERPAPPAPRVTLEWLDRVHYQEPSPMQKPLTRPPHRYMTSATEQMTKAKDAIIWELLYVHGVEPVWQFAPRPRKDGEPSVPERIRGDIIHGVLERMSEEVDLSAVLEETIGEIDMPELESILSPGTAYRTALEQEIERVIDSEEWKWYTTGEHQRELQFLHLHSATEWRFGAFDLFRPDGWIIDFKTHQVEGAKVAKVAKGYELQMAMYREAAAALGVAVRTRLHFTHPGVVIDVP